VGGFADFGVGAGTEEIILRVEVISQLDHECGPNTPPRCPDILEGGIMGVSTID
jgi:hypothetical protein